MLEIGAVQNAVVAIKIRSLPKNLKAQDEEKREECLGVVEEHLQRLKDQLKAREELIGTFCLQILFGSVFPSLILASCANRTFARDWGDAGGVN